MAENYEEVLAPTIYFDKNFQIQAAKILPGEYYATSRDMLLVTVLGSCVAACIRDRQTGVGGMNHFMLPDSNQDADTMVGLPTRYGTYAMEVLINQLLKIGAKRSNLEAKIFGGGNVLRGFTVSNVGQKNSSFVKEFLALEKIPIVAEDLLDIYPRKVYFFPQSGRVLVKKLKSVHNNTIVDREKDYSSRLRQSKVEGDVELFG
ncbi:MAG: chemoreceptor glutamine deamidase CheD [Chitinivorax sp.]|jgi:chemotaxis protein CheD